MVSLASRTAKTVIITPSSVEDLEFIGVEDLVDRYCDRSALDWFRRFEDKIVSRIKSRMKEMPKKSEVALESAKS